MTGHLGPVLKGERSMGPADQDMAAAAPPAAPPATIDGWQAPQAPPAPPVTWGAPSPTPAALADRPTVRQWSARDVGIISVLLGFPSGLGLSAGNDIRLHRTGQAVAAIVALVVGGFLVVLLPAIGLIVSVVTGIVLYRRAANERRVLDAAGITVEPGGIVTGLATIVGAWVLVLVPIVALAFLGSQIVDMQAGTIEFGRGGTGCAVSDATTAFAEGDDVHLAAHLSRTVRPGEVISETITPPAGAPVSSSQAATSDADCLSQGFPVSDPGTYRVEFTTGTERLAAGAFSVSSAASSGP
jgi:hypothetical protein